MILSYIIKEIKDCKKHNKPLSTAYFMKSYKMLRSVKKGKKNIFLIFAEIRRLANYWKAFPDTYFRFGMFMKEFGRDMERMRSFIPQEAYIRYASEGMGGRYTVLISDKILFHDIMSFYKLPVPHRFFSFREGVFSADNRIISDEQVDEIISTITDGRVFVKKFNGGSASGVSVFTKDSAGYVDDNGDILCAKLIRKKYAGSAYFFEKQIIEAESLARFNPDTVNTVRVLTYKNRIISAAVRFGRKGSFVDNAAKGGLVVSLDMATGRLGKYGIREFDLERFYAHPDSHLLFENAFVPQWESIKEWVEKTLRVLPYYTSVGFDVVPTDAGPVIIEINTGAGVYVSQMGKEYGIAKCFIE